MTTTTTTTIATELDNTAVNIYRIEENFAGKNVWWTTGSLVENLTITQYTSGHGHS